MKISIWDLDYYYATNKKNCFNPDVMKISSYHKQMGDSVNFVLTKDDIYRPFDKYYIIKENNKTPNPPTDLMLNKKVIWLGKAYFLKQKWTMPDIIRAARPDYLLYPKRETKMERAEHIMLLGNSGQLLKHKQDYFNTFKNKKVLVVDKKLWFSSDEVVIEALNSLQGIKNLSFFEPIYIQKIIENEEIKKIFLSLNLHSSANFQWEPINLKNETNIDYMFHTVLKHIQFLQQVNETFTHSFAGVLKIYLPIYNNLDKWNQQLFFTYLLTLFREAKKSKIQIHILYSHWRDNSFFFLFNEFNDWTSDLNKFKKSWIEFITQKYGKIYGLDNQVIYWSKPSCWDPIFRDLLRQTCDINFLTEQWGGKKLSKIKIPMLIFKEEFKFGI